MDMYGYSLMLVPNLPILNKWLKRINLKKSKLLGDGCENNGRDS
jgi:hypothetical protein